MPGDDLEHWMRLREAGNRPLGVREAQRMLGLGSPGKTQRLLNRLVRLGLAERTPDGKYVINRDPPLELVGKLVIAGRIYPRILVYAVYSTTLLAAYLALTRPGLATALMAVMLVVPLWAEALLEHRQIKKRMQARST